jgi:hypothetical protein
MQNTEQSNVVATLLSNALADGASALHNLKRARDLVGSDPAGVGRELSVAITHIEDGLLRAQQAFEREKNR